MVPIFRAVDAGVQAWPLFLLLVVSYIMKGYGSDDVGCVVNNGNEKLSNWRQESAKSINRIHNHESRCSAPSSAPLYLLWCFMLPSNLSKCITYTAKTTRPTNKSSTLSTRPYWFAATATTVSHRHRRLSC